VVAVSFVQPCISVATLYPSWYIEHGQGKFNKHKLQFGCVAIISLVIPHWVSNVVKLETTYFAVASR
jgi:hypothetical protein